MSQSSQYFDILKYSKKVPQYWSSKLLNLLEPETGQSSLNIADKNLALYHAVHLVNGDWQPDSDKDWSFTTVKELKIEPKVDEQQLAADFIVSLHAKLQSSKDETFISYEDFAADAASRQFANHTEYLAWQRYFFPYLVAELKAGSVAQKRKARAEAFKRLDLFVAKLPKGDQDELADDIKIAGRRYIFDWLSP